jgi:hypothetical protein
LAEAVWRAVPELVKLERYERRASALRDRAIRSALSWDVATINNTYSCVVGKTKPLL